jgi:pilus assembly protein Flp/PilA
MGPPDAAATVHKGPDSARQTAAPDRRATGDPSGSVYDRLKGFSTHERDNTPRGDAMLWKFLADQRGATAIEYCLIAVFLSVAIVAGARAIGTNINSNMYGPIAGNLN